MSSGSSGLERERKFLVPEPPGDLGRHRHTDISQGYLAIDPGGAEVRVRRRGDRATLTVKRGRGLVRDEVEIELDPAEFERLWPLTDGARVEKTRYEIELEPGLLVECDVYAGDLRGLVVAEVEFADDPAAARFRPPAWFGAEVTEDDAYKNQRLAVDGLP